MTLRSTDSFRREQIRLLRRIEELPVLAHELPSMDVDQRISAVERVVAFLAQTLLPHAEIEQQILYPEAERLLGRRHDGGAVEQDRREVRQRIRELVAADPSEPGAIQEILYALHAVLAIHLEHEAEVYLKLVQMQPEQAVRRLFRRVTGSHGGLTPAA